MEVRGCGHVDAIEVGGRNVCEAMDVWETLGVRGEEDWVA